MSLSVLTPSLLGPRNLCEFCRPHAFLPPATAKLAASALRVLIMRAPVLAQAGRCAEQEQEQEHFFSVQCGSARLHARYAFPLWLSVIQCCAHGSLFCPGAISRCSTS